MKRYIINVNKLYSCLNIYLVYIQEMWVLWEWSLPIDVNIIYFAFYFIIITVPW